MACQPNQEVLPNAVGCGVGHVIKGALELID